MYRSFTDRVFGGVCGGIATWLRVNAWVLRLLFVVLSLLSTGIFVAFYLILWWVVPQDLPVSRGKRFAPLLFLVLFVLVVGVWAARLLGVIDTFVGANVFVPGMLVVLSGIFFVRQLGR